LTTSEKNAIIVLKFHADFGRLPYFAVRALGPIRQAVWLKIVLDRLLA
jgi:hypothetical protein